jgi:hypothetical protein
MVSSKGGAHLAQSLAAQSMANLAAASLGIREPQAPLQLRLQDPVLGNQMLFPQQQ